jgi:hypothetical protein
MNLPKLARLSVLCLILSLTALTAFAQPAPQPCSCEYCSRGGSGRSCILDGTTTTCGYFLAVTTCAPGLTGRSADSGSSVDASFLSLTSEIVQEPLGCMISGN